jgi:diphthine methyl ester acylhydrolase
MDQHGQLISPLQSLILDLPPSCIEFCPAHPDYFVIGTYELQKDEEQTPNPEEGDGEEEVVAATVPQSQSRNGSLVVFHVDGNNV